MAGLSKQRRRGALLPVRFQSSVPLTGGHLGCLLRDCVCLLSVGGLCQGPLCRVFGLLCFRAERGCPTSVAVAIAGGWVDPGASDLEVRLPLPYLGYVIPGYHPRSDLAAIGTGCPRLVGGGPLIIACVRVFGRVA